MRRISTWIVVLAALLVAAPVFAQTTAPSDSSNLGVSVWQNVDFSAQRTRTATPPPTPARGYFGRAAVGIISSSGSTGLELLAGIAARPFGTNKAEVQGDFEYARIEGTNGYGGSGNFLYNFVVEGQKFFPYAGAGIVVLHGGGTTDTGFQILGGINIPMNERDQAFRGELRIGLFSGYHTVSVLGGFSF